MVGSAQGGWRPRTLSSEQMARRSERSTGVNWTLPCRILAACAIAIPFTLAAGAPTGHAKNDDTHVTGGAASRWSGTAAANSA